MENQSEKEGIVELPRVWTPEATWNIQSPSGRAVFLFPAFGPGNYDDVVRQVLASGQRLPTGEQTAHFLGEVYTSTDDKVKKSPRVDFVKKKVINDGWLWVHNLNIWTPQNIRNPGVYVVHDEKGQGLGNKITIEELEDMLSGGNTERGVRRSENRQIAFAPLSTIKSGYHDKGTLQNDGAFIANYGVEGTEKLEIVSNSFKRKTFSWIVNNNSDGLVKSLSALLRGWYRVGRLYAGFDSGGDFRLGYVISVSGSGFSAKGSAPKK